MQKEKNDDWALRCRPYRPLMVYLALSAAWLGINDLLLPGLLGPQHWIAVLHSWQAYVLVALTAAFAIWQLRRMLRNEHSIEELAQVLHHAPVGIARIDAVSHQILWANAHLCDMLDQTPESLHQLDFWQLAVPMDVPYSQQQRQRLMQGAMDSYREESRIIRTSDGQMLIVDCTINAVSSQRKRPMLICVVQDVSTTHDTHAELKRNETQLRLALDSSGSGMWDLDMGRRCYTFSQGVVGMLRFTAGGVQVLQRKFRLKPRLHPHDRHKVGKAWRLALRARQPFILTVRIRCFDDEYRWFEIRGTFHQDTHGQPGHFCGIITDETKQREQEERLRLAATVVDNTREGVVVSDVEGRILSVNRAFTELLGFTEDEMKGNSPRMLKSGRHDKAFYEAMWGSIMHTGHWRGEIWNKRKNGELIPERLSLSAVYDDHGQVSHYVCIFSDISEEKQREEQLEILALRDEMTGMHNRTWIGRELRRIIEEARALNEQLAVILLNLDRFKDVNDSYGHAVGDEVLLHIARQIEGTLRTGDIAARMAGDEFVVVARRLNSTRQASSIAEQLIKTIEQPWKSPDGFFLVIGAHAGICMYPQHAHSASLLLQGAHAAVYGAKQGQGEAKSWCFFHEDMTQAARQRIAMEARLRTAIASGHMCLFYQPQIDVKTGQIVGAEALVRWNDPKRGMISPAQFIPVAEATGLIGPLGTWVINEACRQAQIWRQQGLMEIAVAVNVSLQQFLLTDLVGCTRQALKNSGYPAHLLEMEITESALAERPDEALEVLSKLKALGLRLAIDDFGTGYSSLAHLKRFPIDVLKIDQGFIRDIPHSSDDRAISSAIIAMGRSMEMEVLAEGVETAEQLEFLVQHGCDFYQGYLFSRPLPAADFERLLRTHCSRTD